MEVGNPPFGIVAASVLLLQGSLQGLESDDTLGYVPGLTSFMSQFSFYYLAIGLIVLTAASMQVRD